MADKTVTEVLHEQHELIKAMFDELDATTETLERQERFDCLRAILAVHETAEEELVHPAAQMMGGDAKAAVQLRLDEEATAKRMLADLEKMGPNADGFQALFDEFQTAVLEHAEAEEAEVFPFIDQGLSRENREAMAKQLEAAERLAPTHPHPHGPESAIGNLLVGPFVAMVDKVRDAIKRRAA
jgi:hemerythrin superfamily protein